MSLTRKWYPKVRVVDVAKSVAKIGTLGLKPALSFWGTSSRKASVKVQRNTFSPWGNLVLDTAIPWNLDGSYNVQAHQGPVDDPSSAFDGRNGHKAKNRRDRRWNILICCFYNLTYGLGGCRGFPRASTTNPNPSQGQMDRLSMTLQVTHEGKASFFFQWMERRGKFPWLYAGKKSEKVHRSQFWIQAEAVG